MKIRPWALSLSSSGGEGRGEEAIFGVGGYETFRKPLNFQPPYVGSYNENDFSNTLLA